ncbi:hypothetical protein OYC64_005469 [Pagothenia borchgrevinki]|uniref:Uncharacterized protein n=1 Tax=Pagothenia borchgrevinki TaxID=8213 RepID=A0ABD2GHQ5_PAGBO
MHESVYKSILSSDIDLRRSFLGNIVLSGGNTLLPGLPERLQAEIKGLVPTDTGESVRVTSPKDRDFSVWSGGGSAGQPARLQLRLDQPGGIRGARAADRLQEVLLRRPEER